MLKLRHNLGVCFLLLSLVYAADTFSVNTYDVYLTPNVHAHSSIVLSNDSNQMQNYDVHLYRVYDPGTPFAVRKEVVSLQDADITISSKSFSLAANTKKTIDVAFLGDQVAESTLFQVDISPSLKHTRASWFPLSGSRLTVLPTQQINVFVEPTEKYPALAALPVEDKLRISNIGNLAITLRDGKWCTNSPFCRSVSGLDGMTLYPGNSVYVVKIPEFSFFKATQAWGDENGEIHLTPFFA